ncbi:sulfatase family protein [Prosthecobacter debontii]|nr:sulfatase [Prosthecobacter debontii]
MRFPTFFLVTSGFLLACFWKACTPAVSAAEAAPAASSKPNVLIITTDDMSCDSVGVYGCKLADTTPNMDRLAARGVRFAQAHVVVGNCMPSRNVMWSGRYPHHTGIQGFDPLPREEVKYPVLGELMHAAGWFTGIRGKVPHSTPFVPFPWDIVLDTNAEGKKVHIKDAPSYGESLTQGIEAARKAGQPFCLMLNVSDPHKPFYAEGNKGQTVDDPHVPSRVFTPEEVPVPGFLPDDPVIRKELAHYYSSVRRADDAVGAILAALEKAGEMEKTIILFLSDHGMPLPFAKTQLYHHSTRTPMMMVWPGVTKPGRVEETHMVSAVDLLPTLLEMLNLPLPEGMDGRSFVPVLKGETQEGRDMVFKSYYENSGGQITPMRAVQTKDFLYIFNPWSNGKRVMSGATAGTPTCRQMRVLAKTDEAVAARVDLFDHRRPAEAYDVRYDPDALTNLIDLPAHAAQVTILEQAIEAWMVKTGDPLLDVFRHRQDAAYREQWMLEREQNMKKARGKGRKADRSEVEEDGEMKDEAAPKKGQGPAKAKGKGKGTAMSTAQAHAEAKLIELTLPERLVPGGQAVVKVAHHLPADLGTQPVQITLKSAKNERLERKTLHLRGEGVSEVTFDLPAEVPGGAFIFAGLVGENISTALQHWQSKLVKVSGE